MTEPSQQQGYEAVPPSPAWPQYSQVEVGDPLVQRSLVRLDDLPQTAVTGHDAVYAEIHDELQAALDADPLTAGDHGGGSA